MGERRMKERGILFSPEMVRAILAGLKTETRRIVSPAPGDHPNDEGYESDILARCPYQLGDRLFVREGYQIESVKPRLRVKYLADNAIKWGRLTLPEWEKLKARKYPYRPTAGRFMYKSLARIWLEITEVGIERIQDITEAAAIAEGMGWRSPGESGQRDTFEYVWNKLNSGRGHGWDFNPWVWVIKFKRIEYQPPIQ